MHKNIPYIRLTGKSAPQSNENIFKFDAVTAVIKNVDTGLFLALEFIQGEYGLVGGSIEKGEEKNAAMIREVEEEAGFKNSRIRSIIFEKAYSRGYKARKDREEEALDTVYYVEVEEKDKGEILGADFGTKGVFWLDENHMLDRLTLDHHLHYFKEYLKNR